MFDGLNRLRLRLRAFFHRRRLEKDLEDEFAFHRAMREEALRSSGVKNAETASRRQFGNETRFREQCRELWRFTLLDQLWIDLRYVSRSLSKTWVFTAGAILSVALAIAANTTVFSLLQATLVNSLKFKDPDRLVMISTIPPESPEANEFVAIPEYVALTQETELFDRIGAMSRRSSNLGVADDGLPADRLDGQLFTAPMFNVLGVQPEVGRVFTPAESAIGVPPTVMLISHRLWQSRLGGDPNIADKTVLLDGTATRIIGVMPPSFRFLDQQTDFWRPAPFTPFQLRASTRILTVVAHLNADVSIQQAQDQLNRLAAGFARTDPDRNKGWGLRVRSLSAGYFGDLRQLLFVLQGSAGLVLLIACANVAGLTLIRTSARYREMAIRSSLGADRLRIARQCLTESLVLSLTGGLVGVVLAWGTLTLLMANRPMWLSLIDHVAIDRTVSAFALVVSLATGLAFGAAPVLHLARHDLVGWMKGATPFSGSGRDRQRIQRVLVTAQIAFTLMLLIGAGLVIKSFFRMQHADLGFEPHGLVTFQTRLPADQYFKQVGFANGFPQLDVSPVPATLFNRVFERLQALPHIDAAAGINIPPLSGYAMEAPFSIYGQPTNAGPAGSEGKLPNVYFHFVTPNFFKTAGIPLIRGRDFTADDTTETPWVAIINESMARRHWPRQDAIGQRVILDIVHEERPRQIVGIVGDTALSRWDLAPSPMVYLPQLQLPQRYRVPFGQNRVTMTFLLRSNSSLDALIPEVRRTVAEVDPTLAIAQVGMVEQYLGEQIETPRYYMLVLGLLGAIATILSVLGVYGVVAYSVAQRGRELAIRIALGARGRSIVSLVMRETVLFIVVGMPIGFAGALALTRFLTTVLWQVTTTDTAVFASITLLLSTVALIATLIPACRVLRLDPTSTLRAE